MTELFKDVKPLKTVISASRMTDMPGFYPEHIIREVERRRTEGMELHTLVLWTKHPRSLLIEPLYSYLLSLKSAGAQIFVQLTITGMGGRSVGTGTDGRPVRPEPNAPDPVDSLAALPNVVRLTGNPLRIRLRVDPIIRIRDARGAVYTNRDWLPLVIGPASLLGIGNVSFSLLEKGMHDKVDRRYAKIGCMILPYSDQERRELAEELRALEAEHGVTISACCTRGFPESACLDADLLQSLHDRHEPADRKQPRKRKACGCTKSIDISGWPLKPCLTGCDYCYANARYPE